MLNRKNSPRYIAFFLLGLTSILTQFILVREFLNVFNGNELVIGILFCAWMLFTAAGSRIAIYSSKTPDEKITDILLLILGVLPVILNILLYITESVFSAFGTEKSLFSLLAYCLVFLGPFCIISGALFSRLASYESSGGKVGISVSYGWETIGSVFASLFFTFILSECLTTFQINALLLIINIVFYTLNHIPKQRYTIYYSAYTLLFLSGIYLFLFPPDIKLQSLKFKDQHIIYFHDSAYGKVTLTKSGEQINFFENGIFCFSTSNSQLVEEAVHYALLQKPRSEKILIISGGYTNMTNEVLKYHSVKQIDYLAMNPGLLKSEKELIPEVNFRVNLISEDARRYLRKKSCLYDIIIINAPDPSNVQTNRFYTLEFFNEVKRALKNGGVMEISLTSTGNYVSPEALHVNGILYHTLLEMFKKVIPFTGERNFYIATDDEVGINISERVALQGLKNDYVNPYYIDDALLKQRIQLLIGQLNNENKIINRDAFPKAYILQLQYWMVKTEGRKLNLSLLSIFFLVTLLLTFQMKGVNTLSAGLFSSAFAAASAQFQMLMLFQISYGYIYRMIGAVVGLFMTGLASGAFIPVRYIGRKPEIMFITAQMLLIILMLVLPITEKLLGMSQNREYFSLQLFIYSFTLIVSFITGLIFNLSVEINKRFNGGDQKLYGIDLAGAALGTLLTALVFLPFMGITKSTFIPVILLVISLLLFLAKQYKTL